MKMELTRRAFLQLTATVLILPSTPFAGEAEAKRILIPVLLYHDISYELSDDYTLHPRIFAAQMEWLYANGYRAVSFDDLNSTAAPKRAVVITFDDGYASFIPYVLPFLQAYGFKATINIIGQYVGSYLSDGGVRPMLSWDEYRYLAATGLVGCGCHTYRLHTHRHQGAAGVSNEVLLEDLTHFQNVYAREMGARSKIMAWPYGFYSENSIAVAQKAGFRYLLTSKKGVYRHSDGTTEIPRSNVTANEKLSTFQSRIEVN
jgi:peptidoglycan/xylan/chitin deacetylase (PgdA/CDA1 family)